MTLKVTVLGSGSSGGVPLVGCSCAVCKSTDPKNRRLRVSIVVESATTRILVDASPDLRAQLLASGFTKFDAVIFTHAHADHMHGIDELRAINHAVQAPLDCWSDGATLAEARTRFGYAFGAVQDLPGGFYVVPVLRPREIELGRPFRIGDIDIVGFEQLHGGDRTPTLGLRFGRFAYSTDVKTLDATAFATLAGVDTWMVDCLQEQPNWAHSHLAQTLDWIGQVAPRRAVLTHMNHRVDYAGWRARLPAHVEPAFDGLVLEIP
ncbi:MAG: MBL fold metallo-hydrolase [Proteobacteria bacterium]|nr:MBL fold metallo-hydrolase [Pseudomonadota bacterium]